MVKPATFSDKVRRLFEYKKITTAVRTFKINDPDANTSLHLCSNYISTAYYNRWNFLPLSLLN